VYSVAWSPTQADLVATGGGDDRAFLWRVGQEAYEETGGEVLELSGHTDTISGLAFSADGTALASAGMDGRVKVWEAATGRCLQTLEGAGEAMDWVRWHPKGGVLLAGAADFSAWMWLAQTGACMQVRNNNSCWLAG
jgi:ribosome assembly protein SQT1